MSDLGTAARVGFQSTRPSRGATILTGHYPPEMEISIHAPHAGRDRAGGRLGLGVCNFNPRAPCGARHYMDDYYTILPSFQSTRPMRGATSSQERPVQAPQISIHAPHAGRDAPMWKFLTKTRNFNPRAPCGARLAIVIAVVAPLGISIHAPHAGRDWWATTSRW